MPRTGTSVSGFGFRVSGLGFRGLGLRVSGVGLGSRLVGLRVCRVSRACKANTKPLPKVSIVVPVFGLTKYIIYIIRML